MFMWGEHPEVLGCTCKLWPRKSKRRG